MVWLEIPDGDGQKQNPLSWSEHNSTHDRTYYNVIASTDPVSGQAAGQSTSHPGGSSEQGRLDRGPHSRNRRLQCQERACLHRIEGTEATDGVLLAQVLPSSGLQNCVESLPDTVRSVPLSPKRMCLQLSLPNTMKFLYQGSWGRNGHICQEHLAQQCEL